MDRGEKMENPGSSRRLIPQVHQEIETTCDFCRAPLVGRVFDQDAWKKNTDALIEAAIEKDRESEAELNLDVLAWMCSECGFTYCRAKNRHAKELGLGFWSFFSSKELICPRCKKPLTHPLYVVAPKEQKKAEKPKQSPDVNRLQQYIDKVLQVEKILTNTTQAEWTYEKYLAVIRMLPTEITPAALPRATWDQMFKRHQYEIRNELLKLVAKHIRMMQDEMGKKSGS
jgi:hypothetical protein